MEFDVRYGSTFLCLEERNRYCTNDVGDFTNTVGGDAWRLCEELSRFLQPFALASKRLTASKHITSSLVIPSLHVIKKTLLPVVNVDDDQQNDSKDTYQIRSRLKEAFENTLQGT
jgi:hypothetical protein